MAESDPDETTIPNWPAGWPTGPFGWRDGRLTFFHTIIPTPQEIDGLAAAVKNHTDDIVKAAEPIEILMRSKAHTYPWNTLDGKDLLTMHTWSSVLQAWWEGEQPARLCYGMLLLGGWLPFIATTFYLEARGPIQAELERREAQNPVSAQAGALAVAMGHNNLRDRWEVELTIEALRERIHIPTSVRGLRRESVPLVELLGQIPLTLLKEIDTTEPLQALADALAGGHAHIPQAVTRDLQDEAEHHRRWEGRGGKHARGPRRLETVAAEAFDEAPEDTESEGTRHRQGPKGTNSLPTAASAAGADLKPEAVLIKVRAIAEVSAAEAMSDNARRRQRQLKPLRDELRQAAGKPPRTRRSTKKKT